MSTKCSLKPPDWRRIANAIKAKKFETYDPNNRFYTRLATLQKDLGRSVTCDELDHSAEEYDKLHDLVGIDTYYNWSALFSERSDQYRILVVEGKNEVVDYSFVRLSL